MGDNIIRATNGPKHHLFGFHDLIAVNQSGDKILCIEVDTFNRPPLPGEKFGVGYSLWEEQRFVRLGETVALNYPQGSRQEWLSDTEFIVNNRVGDHWGADIYDTESGTKVSSLDSPIHCMTKEGRLGFSINYSRLHRMGGYGYIGIPDPTMDEAKPKNDGIYVTDIASNQTKLLVSIAQVTECDPATSPDTGFHHYLTHLLVSPDDGRIAFLHRCCLPDGGLRTRLMTVGTDGSDLRCLGFGFLSHFDWRDNGHIFIWGRSGGSVDAMRSNPIFSNPIVKPFLGVAKKVARKVLKKSSGMSMNFLMFEDADNCTPVPFAQGIITSDGHPMCCPTNREICVCDTYPDGAKCRNLFLYNFSTNERTDIGRFRMSDEQPDTTMVKQYTRGVDKAMLEAITPAQLSFTRSGLHCDLHPRWDYNGKMVVFDSIHEGTRQVYLHKM